MVKCDRRLTIQVFANELNMDKETIRQILTQDLVKHKICSRYVFHHLRVKQKQLRLDECGELINNADVPCVPGYDSHRRQVFLLSI